MSTHPRRSRRWLGTRLLLELGALAVVVAFVAAVTDPAPDVFGADAVEGSAPTVASGDLLAVAYGPRPEQVLDLHRPADVGGPLPVVLFAHSGGWIAGTRVAVPDVIAALGPDLGVAIVSIDYRLVGTAPDGSYTNTFPTAMWDVDRAIRFVRAHAREWDLDPDRIVVAGASAGGHLAALAGAAPGRFTDPELPAALMSVSPVVSGVIDYVGPSDLHTFPAAGGWAPALTAALLGCAPVRPDTCDPARVDDAGVAAHLAGRPPPAYFAYGERDQLVLAATQGAPLADAWARQRGEPGMTQPERGSVWYLESGDADHNFDNGLDGGLLPLWLEQVLDGRLR